MDSPKIYYKVTNREESGYCEPGGFYFIDHERIHECVHEIYIYGSSVREIILPIIDPNFKMVPDGNKDRANMVILGKRYDIFDYNAFLELNLNPPFQMMNDFIENGNLDVLKKFMEKNLLENHELYFQRACRYGRLNVAQWLLSISKININADNDYAFRFSCLEGHLNVAQWLLSINGKININAKNDYAFRLSCARGHLNVAQWLLAESGTININVRDDYAFRLSCANGHLSVAQWLLTVSDEINIHAVNEYAFQKSLINGYIQVIQWLTTIEKRSID